MTTKSLLIGAMMVLVCASTQAQVPVTGSTTAPVPGFYDEYYLPGGVVEGSDTIGSPFGASGNNDPSTYVSYGDRTSKAQSFTTGSAPLGYALKSFTFQQAQGTNGAGGDGNGWLGNGTFLAIGNGDSVKVRVGTITSGPLGATYTTILETNAIYTGTTYNQIGGTTSALGIYFNFDLSGANLTLISNTTYFVEMMTTAGSVGNDHIELNNTSTNPVSRAFPPLYVKGRALIGNTGNDLDRTGTFGTPANSGEYAFVATIPAVGAPTVVAAVKPTSAAPGQTFKVTAAVTPGIGTVTNVSVDLSVIGGASASKLVLSNANVYTNTFTVASGAPLVTTNLTVTVTQDTQPLLGVAKVAFSVVSAQAPQVVQDVAPGTMSYYIGQGITFSASFSGPQPITYIWLHGGRDDQSLTNIIGATNVTYTISSATVDSEGYYQIQASNSFGTTLSSFGYLTLLPGTPTFLWSAPIPFANLNADQILTNFPANYKIAGALVAQNGGSPITVTNSSGSVIVFAGARTWAALSGGTGFFTGANTNLTGNQPGNTNFNNCLNSGYTDNATHTITLSNLTVGQQYQVQLFALDDRSGLSPVGSSRLVNWQDPADATDLGQTFTMADNVYMLGTFTATNSVMAIQQNIPASSGNFNCLVLRAIGWTPPPYIARQPVNVGGFVGTNVSFTASAAGDSTIANPAITYQWQGGPVGGPYTNLVEGAKYAGTTKGTLTISNLVIDDGVPVYLLTAVGSAGSVTSTVAHVYVQAPPVPPVAGSFGAYALSNNAVGFWQLSETNDPSTGFVVAYDYTGKGNNGTYGTAAKNAFNGIMGPTNLSGFAANQGALETASGNNASQVTIPPFNLNTNSATITTNGVTIAMWIKPTAGQATFTGLFMYRNNTVEGFGFGGTQVGGMAGLGYTWNNNNASTYNFSSGLYPPVGVWSFVGVVVSSNSATIFLDYVDPNTGQPVRLSAVNNLTHTSYTFNGGNTAIGGDPNAGAGRTFIGDISDVAIYNSALTSDNILQLFGAGLASQAFSPLVQFPAQDVFYPAPLAAGRGVTLTAVVNGTLPLTNQWKYNGVNLTNGALLGATVSGSQTASLTVTNITYNNAGSYQLFVTNAYGITNTLVENINFLPATLVGQWLSVSNSLADASGYTPPGTHDATVVAGSTYWTNDVPAIAPPGSASLYFNAAGLRIANSATTDVGYTNTFDNKIYNGLTVMCWAKGLPNGTFRTFVAKNGEDNGWQIRVGSRTNSATWTIRNPQNQDMSAIRMPFLTNTPGTLSGLVWHHYAGTYSPVTGVRSLYMDGTLIAQQTGETAYSPASLYHLTIGQVERASGIGDGPYTGAMYDVRVYDYALDQSGIASIVGLPEARTQYAIPGAAANFGTVGINAAPPYYGYQWQFNGANLTDGADLGATVSGSGTLAMTISNITANNAGLYQLLVTNAVGVTTSSIVKLTVQPTNMVGRWLSGSQTMADGSGFSPAGIHDAGVQSGSVIWTNDVPPSAPPGSYALYFPSAGAGLIISNSSPWDPAYTNTFDDQIYKDMTVMCWAKGLPPGTWQPWVSKEGDNGTSLPNVGWQLRINNAGPNSCWTIRGTGGNEDMTSSIGTGDGKWHHYTGTYSASTGVRSLYVDGLLTARQTGQGPYSPLKAAHLMIGAQDNGTGVAYRYYYTGTIYDVRVYNYALSQSQLGATVPGLTPSFTSRQFTTGAGGNAGQFVLSWPFGTLLEATNVTGPWNPTTNTSPFTNTTTLPDEFFRLSNP